MRVLVMNCGSSTLKFQLIDTPKGDAIPASERYLARGVIERKGGRGDRRGRNLAEYAFGPARGVRTLQRYAGIVRSRRTG